MSLLFWSILCDFFREAGDRNFSSIAAGAELARAVRAPADYCRHHYDAVAATDLYLIKVY